MPEAHPSSFRDRSGHVFWEGDVLKRRITEFGIADFRQAADSGFFEKATAQGLLVGHAVEAEDDSEITLLPERIPIISYPYEWCFSQLKDAALLTLSLQELAMAYGLSLKDASAYNVQFVGCKPLFIDSSSFEIYTEGQPWIAYRQFCEHFLSPLFLMSKVDVRLGRLLASFIDGIPIEIASKVAPTFIGPWLSMHVKLHARAKVRSRASSRESGSMKKQALLGLIASLRQAVQALDVKSEESTWGDYTSATSYGSESSTHKHELVREYVGLVQPRPAIVWDLGANAGEFSRICSEKGLMTISWDLEHEAVERNYREAKRAEDSKLLPLLQDLTCPSPSLGWMLQERASFMQRGPADLTMALALIHHLVIGNSVPMDLVAQFLSETGKWLIVEYVHPEDPRVEQLKSTRTSTHPYDRESFLSAFSSRYDVIRSDSIRGSQRTLFLMHRKT